ncbi:MAG: ATPase, partial [Muribaculaceae bacterium]|nr:ATPase [Muribaculaceae bacterium]
IHNMVKEEFREFFRRNVALYPDSHTLPVSFTGSVAYHFSDLLRETAREEGFSVSVISGAPMEGMIAFHLS